MTKTETQSAEDILAAAKALTGEIPVVKAADVEKAEAKEDDKGDDKKKDSTKDGENPFAKTEKGIVLTPAELDAVVQKAVDAGFNKAQAALESYFAPVTKSLAALTGDSEAIRAYQGATTLVLTNLKENGDATGSEVADVREIVKSVMAEVSAIGNQPAGPRSAVVDEVVVAKAAPAALDMDKVNEIAKSMDDMGDRVSVKKFAKSGNLADLSAMLTPSQRRTLGL